MWGSTNADQPKSVSRSHRHESASPLAQNLRPCGDMPCLHDGEIGAPLWEIVLAKSVAGKPCLALRLVPREGTNLARKLP